MKYEKWTVAPPDPAALAALEEAGISPLLAAVLSARGVRAPQEARALLEEWGEAGAASTEKALEGIRSAMTEEELEIYDPLEAYRQLVDWLE